MQCQWNTFCFIGNKFGSSRLYDFYPMVLKALAGFWDICVDFKQYIKNGDFPGCWNKANVVLIFYEKYFMRSISWDVFYKKVYGPLKYIFILILSKRLVSEASTKELNVIKSSQSTSGMLKIFQ